MRRYRTILADRPWEVPSQHGRYSTRRHYPLITIEEICALRVDRLAADNVPLWLWVINVAWREQVNGRGSLGLQLPEPPDVDQATAGTWQVRRARKAPVRFRGLGMWLYARSRRTVTSPKSSTP